MSRARATDTVLSVPGNAIGGSNARTASGRARLGREQNSFMQTEDIGLFRARSTQKGIRARGE